MFIPMAPMGKARPRVTKRGHAFMPRSYKKWKAEFGLRAKNAWQPWPPINGPFLIRITIGTKSGKMRSDLDNSAGSVLDALQDAGLIANDRDCRQLSARIIVTKQPGISVEVEAVHNLSETGQNSATLGTKPAKIAP
jgi:Holliday junction resolvase RusA-like endonuclease